MFRKRNKLGTRKRPLPQQNDDPILTVQGDEDDIINDIQPSPLNKRPSVKNSVQFRKSATKLVAPSRADNAIASLTSKGNQEEDINNHLENQNHSSYFSQFDEDEEDFSSEKFIINTTSAEETMPCKIITHRLTPPFLDSSIILSQTNQIVDIVKDKSGDLYRLAKSGSHLLNERRKTNANAEEKKDMEGGNTKKTLNKVNEEVDDNSNGEDDADIGGGVGPGFDDDNQAQKVDVFRPPSRKDLPAYKVKDTLLKLINENQVLIVIGETGSGKTTQLPQFLYEQGYHHNGMIGITQPRRVAAVSVAKRVSEEMRVPIGDEVGFTIRFNDTTSEKTRIKFMTDGVLLRETLNDSLLNKYSCVIMDEAHERSLNTDILFGILKKVLMKRRDFKLIITSATMNSSKFAKFFNNSVQFKIPGKTFPVDIMFQSVPATDYIDSAVKQALKIHLSTEFIKGGHGDILVFMTGQEDIEVTCQTLQEELGKLQKINPQISSLDILPIYSNLSGSDQSKIFDDSRNRKCIVATNIAETSLTLNHVKFVIDSGLMKLKVYNPRLNMDFLQMLPISKAQANQRSGRAGRVCPGQCFRLYTLSTYEQEMWDDPIPEIQRSNLINTILLLKNLNIENINSFQFIDKPSPEAVETSQYDLWSIGALDNLGKLTTLGHQLSMFPIDPILAKFLVVSNKSEFGCCLEALRIISVLSVPPVFTKVKRFSELAKKADQVRENFQIDVSDHLTLLNIFNQFYNLQGKPIKVQKSWCEQNFFNFKSLKNSIEIYQQLKQLYAKTTKSRISSCMNNWDIIKKCICACFYGNAAEFHKHGEYKHLRTGLEMHINSTSNFNGISDLPEYVVFHELMLTGQKQQMHYITAVEPEWLIQYGHIFYSRMVRGVSTKENQRVKELEFFKQVEREKAKEEESTL